MARSHESDDAIVCAIVPTADRRALPRRPAGLLVRAWRVVDDEACDPVELTLTDVSAAGVGMRSSVPLDSGGLYRLDLDDGQPIHLRVTRSRRRFDGTWDVGAPHA